MRLDMLDSLLPLRGLKCVHPPSRIWEGLPEYLAVGDLGK